MDSKQKFQKDVYEEMNKLIAHFKGKDIRTVIPAICATVEYYANEQFPHVRKYAKAQLRMAANKIKK